MKGLKVFLIGCLILFLAACNQNAGDSAGQQIQRENDLQQVGNRNGLDESGRRDLEDRTAKVRHNNQNDQRGNNTVPNDAIQRINNGFITIEQNSYSTTIPSSKFPHSKYITEGQFEFYLNENEKSQSQNQQGKAEAGRTPEAQQPDREQAPANQPAPQQPRTEQAPADEPAPQKDLQTQGITQTEQRVIELTNAERRKNGLSDLQADTSLSNVAREKSRDMQQNNYFSHTSPTYGSPFDMMRDFGVNYQSAGENIAKGQRSPEEVVNAWMNSEGHRKNILSGDYTHIGVGYNQNGNYWTQMFIKK